MKWVCNLPGGSVGRKEQKLYLGLEGDTGVYVLKAGREPKEAGKTVQAVFPAQLPGQDQDLGNAFCPSWNLDQFIVWFELPQLWCKTPAIACALLLLGWRSSGWRRRAQTLPVLMQTGQQRFSVADLPFWDSSTQVKVIAPSLLLSLNLNKNVPGLWSFSRARSLSLLMKPTMQL